MVIILPTGSARKQTQRVVSSGDANASVLGVAILVGCLSLLVLGGGCGVQTMPSLRTWCGLASV